MKQSNDAMIDLLKAKLTDPSTKLEELGTEIGRLYTDHGLPLDMSLEKLDLPKQQTLKVLDGACQWFITHKRNSGAGEKAIDRQRAANRKMLENFIAKGETGVY